MASPNLTDPSSSNQKRLSQNADLVTLRDELHEQLRQSSALASVASSLGFAEVDKDTIRHYLLLLHGLNIAILEKYDRLDKYLDKF